MYLSLMLIVKESKKPIHTSIQKLYLVYFYFRGCRVIIKYIFTKLPSIKKILTSTLNLSEI